MHLLFSQTRKNYDVEKHKTLAIKTTKNGKIETVARGRSASLSYPYRLKKFRICQECQVTKHKASAMGLLLCMLSITLTYFPRPKNGKADVLTRRLNVRKMCIVVLVRLNMEGWNRQCSWICVLPVTSHTT